MLRDKIKLKGLINLLTLIFVITIFNGCKNASQDADSQDSTAEEAPKEEEIVVTEFADEIEAFTQADNDNPPAEGAALFVGSSSIRKWETLEADMAPYPVINRGFGGSTFRELNYYADKIVYPYNPKCVFVYEGDNDISNEEISPEDVVEAFRKFHSNLQAQSPETMTFFISIKPSVDRANLLDKAMKTNGLIQAFAQTEPTVEYVNVATQMLSDDGSIRTDIFVEDNLHMNAAGYAIWTPVIKTYLKRVFDTE